MNMQTIKAILFDADGVAVLPAEPFSVQYAQEKGFDPKELSEFFSAGFPKAMIGQADLAELLEEYRDAWHLDGTPEELLTYWCEKENHPNQELVTVIAQLRQNGIKCYLATNQEKHRTAFLRSTMFAGVFDEILSSAEIGAMKPSQEYFDAVIEVLKNDGIAKDEAIYFDDSQKNVDAALRAGIASELFHDVEQVELYLS